MAIHQAAVICIFVLDKLWYFKFYCIEL